MHVQPAPPIEVSVVPAGTDSVTVIVVPAGTLFSSLPTSSVNVTVEPIETEPSGPRLWTSRSGLVDVFVFVVVGFVVVVRFGGGRTWLGAVKPVPERTSPPTAAPTRSRTNAMRLRSGRRRNNFDISTLPVALWRDSRSSGGRR